MSVEKKIVKKALNELFIKTFLEKELDKAGVASIELQKTPIATRISISVRRPGIVVGKRGMAIRDLCEELEKNYGVDNPQIEVIEVERPELNAKLMAEKIGRQIELNPRVKPIVRMTLQDIMRAGAIGAETRASGKIVGKGGKAKTVTARAGYLKKSGHLMRLVQTGYRTAYLKAGAIGITVRIVPKGTVFPDKIDVDAIDLTQITLEPLPTQEQAQASKEQSEKDKKERKQAKGGLKKPRKPKTKAAGKEQPEASQKGKAEKTESKEPHEATKEQAPAQEAAGKGEGK